MSTIYPAQRIFAHGVVLLAVGVLAVSPVAQPTTTDTLTPPGDVPTVVGQSRYGVTFCEIFPFIPGCNANQ